MTPSTDYYSLLEVEKNADLQTIRSAYRRLVRNCHPDVSNDPEDHDRFKRYGEAYEILSDPRKRKQYDMLSALSFGLPLDKLKEKFGDGRAVRDMMRKVATGLAAAAGLFRNRSPKPGRDMKIETEIPFETGFLGGKTAFELEQPVACDTCRGTGFSEITPCETCSGAGRLSSNGLPGLKKICPRCGGNGWVGEIKCETCLSTGRIGRNRNLTVNIPPGISPGQRLRVKGLGEQGIGSAGPGPFGDLMVKVNIPPHPLLSRSGKDLTANVTIDLETAYKGGSALASHPTGSLTVEVPPLSWQGRRLRVQGAGFPDPAGSTSGDAFYTIEISEPAEEDEKEIYSSYIQTITGPSENADSKLIQNLQRMYS
jgi:molecular chaperone DnaJ